ncbi:type II and III secretion system protein [Endomicrobium proavitum]|uniref:Type II and III secretion system protein n=1 Tax=Endomicrobium proavitum TaxID=1408281 RepID=A0A0G3WIG0_9BACT|nr:type II and III secretion system protein [Endomicrobium proavitum]AKL97662.1 Type II and III secretion system protein [Endomicrobium proavitum]
MKKFLALAILFFSTLGYCEQMVEISVEITEINENKSLELGVKFPDAITAVETSIPSIIESGAWQRVTEFSATLKALEANGAAKVLSKPKLVTKSGTTAKFMVGGEFPVVATAIGTSQIEWKEYGIMMSITPVVKDNKIDIKLETELSRLDYNAPVAGYPSVAKRKASSNLQIKDGETMVLAGLIETTKGNTVEGIPLLCDIPILGALFSYTKHYETKTNVLIFVTTKIIQQ